uniref:Uncharacterized protein n=1 Tax=Anguilla anguilla TaxID=7936 RepID=A0A0E9PRZ0_ANGAN
MKNVSIVSQDCTSLLCVGLARNSLELTSDFEADVYII